MRIEKGELDMWIKYSSFILFLLITGCGHTLYHKVQGTGLYGRIPTPEGGSLIQIAIGDLNITSSALRGGATLDENSSKGGTFGSVSLARHTHLNTIPAMNEGYIKDVLISDKSDEKTKQMIAKYLIQQKQIEAPPAAVTSVNSASATGDEKNIPKVSPTKTGVDNAIDKAAQIAPEVVQPIANNTKEVINHISDNVESGTKSVMNNFWNKFFIIIIIVIVFIWLYMFFKKKINKKQKNVNYIEKF